MWIWLIIVGIISEYGWKIITVPLTTMFLVRLFTKLVISRSDYYYGEWDDIHFFKDFW